MRKAGASGYALPTLCVSEWVCVSVCTHACTRTRVCTGVWQVCMGLHACAIPSQALVWTYSAGVAVSPERRGHLGLLHIPRFPRGPQSLALYSERSG